MAKMMMGKLSTTRNFRRKFRYEFVVAGLPDLTYFCESVDAPELTIDPVEVTHQTETVWYPGRISWGDIRVVLIEAEGSSSLNQIWEKWIKEYYVSPAQGYITWKMASLKKDCQINILNSRGRQTANWVLEGCWPTVLNPGDWDYGSSEVQKIDLTLKYDRAYYQESSQAEGGEEK